VAQASRGVRCSGRQIAIRFSVSPLRAGLDDPPVSFTPPWKQLVIGKRSILEDLVIQKLDGEPPFGFDCGRAEQNEFLYERAWDDQQEFLSTTYLFLSDDVLAAYATVLMDSLSLSRTERGGIPYRHVSACKVGQLGVDRRFQARGLGRFSLSYAVALARDVAARIACRYVSLDAQPDLIEWYERFGFTVNRGRQAERIEDARRHQRDHHAIAVSMRLDLRAL